MLVSLIPRYNIAGYLDIYIFRHVRDNICVYSSNVGQAITHRQFKGCKSDITNKQVYITSLNMLNLVNIYSNEFIRCTQLEPEGIINMIMTVFLLYINSTIVLAIII